MFFKKAVSICLIASQFGLASTVFAGGSTAMTISRTPEATLLQDVIALQGANLSDKDMQTQVRTALSEYASTSQEEGRSERLKQALVDMNVYTPAQAASFLADAETLNTNIAHNEMTAETAVSNLAGLHPMGAQFSACAITLAVTGLAGLTAVITGSGGVSSTDEPRFGIAIGSFGLAVIGLIVVMETTICH